MAKGKKSGAKPARKTNSKAAVTKKNSGPASKKGTKTTVKKSSPPASKKVKAKKGPSPKPKKAVKKPVVKPADSKLKKVVKAVGKLIAPLTGKGKKAKQGPAKTRYSDSELTEFRQLIIEKLEAAKKELKYLQDQISRTGDNSTDDTENKYASMDDGSSSMEREYLNQMAARQRLYIDHLDKALVRIQNKTYGICRVTGKLIEKDRLRAVPHATLSMEAKMMQSHPQHTNNA